MSPPARFLARQKTVAALVTAALLALGFALYAALPDQMAIHWNAAGEPDNVVAKPVAILAMPAIVVFMSVLFEVAGPFATQAALSRAGARQSDVAGAGRGAR